MKNRIDAKLVPECPNPIKDLLIWENVSDEIEIKNSKRNPFGWSYHEMWWKNEKVGSINSGFPEIAGENWQMAKVIDPSDNLEHVFFFKGLTKEEWSAIGWLEKYK